MPCIRMKAGAGIVAFFYFMPLREALTERKNVRQDGHLESFGGMQWAYANDGLDLPDPGAALEDQGHGWLHRRSQWRRAAIFQSAALSLFVHLALCSILLFIPRHADHVMTPWISVQLVSLEAKEPAQGSGMEDGMTTSLVMGPLPSADQPPAAALPPPEPPPLPAEIVSTKQAKATANPAVAHPRPESKPKELPRTAPRRQHPFEAKPAALAPPQPANANGATSAVPLPDLGDSRGVGSGAAGGGTAKGHQGGGHGGGIVDAEFGAANGPRFARRIVPQYPRLARQLGKEGTVVLRVTIDECGRPMTVESVKTAGAGFDEEAIKAIRGSLFHPAQRNGKPVICRAIVPIRFELRGSD